MSKGSQKCFGRKVPRVALRPLASPCHARHDCCKLPTGKEYRFSSHDQGHCLEKAGDRRLDAARRGSRLIKSNFKKFLQNFRVSVCVVKRMKKNSEPSLRYKVYFKSVRGAVCIIKNIRKNSVNLAARP